MKGLRLVLKIVFIYGALLFHLSACGQSPELALKNIEKKKWDRAYVLLIKTLAKDSLNVTAKYVLAQYFFSQDNPSFHLDSAHILAQEAMRDFQQATDKQRARMRRFPLDSIYLTRLGQEIDSVAFHHAKILNTEEALAEFIRQYSNSSQVTLAVERRDSIGYAEALKENTFDAFLNLINRYPQSKQLLQAKKKYEALLFESKTSDQTLASLENFLNSYPDTPYKFQIEQKIFEYQTAAGEKEKFADFIKHYPNSPFIKKAKNILFHLIPESPRGIKWVNFFSDDSLQNVMALEHNYLVPFFQNGKFGFMDKDGTEVISPQVDTLAHTYLCGNITEDIIALPDKIVSRNGALIWPGKITSMNDLGFGFLLIESKHCRSVIHKSGFRISQGCIENARILSGRLLAIQQNGLWSVWTLAGRNLMRDLAEVYSVKDVIVLKKKDRYRLVTIKECTTLPLPLNLEERQEVDEVISLPHDLVLVKDGDTYGLLNQALEVQTGVVGKGAKDSLELPAVGQPFAELKQVAAHDPWVAAKIDSLWKLYIKDVGWHIGAAYDTIIFLGPFALAYKKDSVSVYFSEKNLLSWPLPLKAELVPGQGSDAFLVAEKNDVKSVYTRAGQKLFSVKIDKIQYAGYDHFIAEIRGKKGLINMQGKWALPAEYDAIGSANNGMVSLLKSTRFGLFDCIKKKLVKPQYSKNLFPYNSNILIAFKNGFYGFIAWDNKPLSKFEFNEIQFWNDSAAFVKKDAQWLIYEISTRTILLDKVKKIKWIRDNPDGKLAIIQQGNAYGVLHSREGTVVPISYSDLKNVGSAEEPMYFTEKNVEEASIFVVIYYDDDGKFLRKEIYEHDDYERIYCMYN